MNIENMTYGELKKIAALFQVNDRPHHGKFLGEYVIIRTYSAGVHCGTLAEYLGSDQILLRDSRRIHYWQGAFTLSRIAIDGLVTARMSCIVPEIILHEIEILPCSDKAASILKELKEHTI